MALLDIHTHSISTDPCQAIRNCLPQEFSSHAEGYFSIGQHPWYLADEKPEEMDRWKELIFLPQVLAIGETGLDKTIPTPVALQEEFFLRQIGWAEESRKPLILHIVHATPELIALKKRTHPSVPWVIHGFRGKKELAREYIRHGFYLSFGEKYHEEALFTVPIERLFLETDESREDIRNLYQRAAQIKNIPTGEFISRISENIAMVFLRHS